MKKLVATAPRVAALVEYEDRAILANEVKIRVRFGAPKHGTEVVDFRAASPFIDEDFNGEWQMFTPRPADAPRGIEFGKFQLGNMVVGDIIECGSDVTDYAVGDSVCGYGPLSETVIINAVNNYKLRKMPQGSSWKNAVCYDPAQFAMSGVRDANVRVGDFVVVVGLGAIGQIAIQLAIGDFYHMNIEEDNLAQALHDNRDLLGHVHIADNHRYQPGSGTLDFHALFEQLRADNYQGYVVYEGRIRAEDPAQAYRDSLAWLRTC